MVGNMSNTTQLDDINCRAELLQSKYKFTKEEAEGVVSGKGGAVKAFERLTKQTYCNDNNSSRIDGIPYYYLFSYLPKNEFKEVAKTEAKIRSLIYSFKNGSIKAQKIIDNFLFNVLYSTFRGYLTLLNFVCVPASSASKNEQRYKRFLSSDFMSACFPENTYDWIKVAKDAPPKHLGSEEPAEYSFDKDVWKGKMVVLFDDVVTSGNTIKNFKNKIESLGAQVVFLISLGKTRTIEEFAGFNNNDQLRDFVSSEFTDLIDHPFIESFNPPYFQEHQEIEKYDLTWNCIDFDHFGLKYDNADLQYRIATKLRGHLIEQERWMLEAAQKGQIKAQSYLGTLYQFGKGKRKERREVTYIIPPDSRKAAFWFLKAAEQGDSDAQYRSGKMYEEGKGVDKNIDEALKWYFKAADNGSIDSMMKLANLYEEGLYVKANIHEAARWYRKAAINNNTEAQKTIARMYEEGIGVKQSYRESARWYRKLANNNQLEAMKKMAMFYKGGLGVKQSNQEANRWHQKAIEWEDFINKRLRENDYLLRH